MDPITTQDPQSRSADIVAENIAQLRQIFPEAFTEGQVDFDVLKQLLGGAVDEQEEKYGLNWYGKRRARQLALTPSTGTLRPATEESVDWETTQNLMIEGDNLEVLKLLQKSYAGKVKMIYIDPPYNTGNDFVYPDDYRDSIQNYLELTGQVEGERKLTSNTETSGRFHTDWLNMIYPRLKVARNLLCDDGIIFISIDDEEVSNLRQLLDLVFGSENFLACLVWKKRSSPDARTVIGTIHDYILCYTKNSQTARSAISKMGLKEDRQSAYTNTDDDPRGPWASVDMTGQTGRAPSSQYYEITLPSGRKINPPEGRAWGLSLATFEELRRDNRIWFGKNGDNVPRIKKFLSESDGQSVPSFWDMSHVGSNDEAKKDVNDLMEKPNVFDTPKPVRLLKRMIEIASRKDDNSIIIDFFAGSGTTAHAAMQQNAEDGGSRRYILIQLPEVLDPANKNQKTAAQYCDELGVPRTIAELTKERLRRAGVKLKKENPEWDGDTGFRVFKLDSSNIRAWDPDADDLSSTLLGAQDNLKPDRTEQDILYELLLKRGLDLAVPIETRQIAGKAVHSIGAGVLLACLAERITRSEVEALAQGIIAWRDELAPVGDSQVVFRDSGFEDDVAKTNLTAILGQHDLKNVRSL
jgi:adenine-specific DNA-methyltransferase